MGQSSDQIRQEIDHQRADAGQRIDDLQAQLHSNADRMQQQVQDTAEHVRGQVEGTVSDAVHSVQNMDFNKQIQGRPLVSVGAALLGGFLLGGLLNGEEKRKRYSSNYSSGNSDGSSASDTMRGVGGQLRNAAQKSGLEDTITNAGAALMGSITEQIKGTLDSNFPGFSDKLDTAQSKRGSFPEKSRATQQEAQQR
jgi:ElaB/YqjD/DUF883 family membrane-anchored ribosome-binding protein